MPRRELAVMLSETKGRKDALTFVLFRRPFEPSIQMYSARTLPLWSNFMYLANWRRVRFAQTKDTRNKTHVGSVRNHGRFTDACSLRRVSGLVTSAHVVRYGQHTMMSCGGQECEEKWYGRGLWYVQLSKDQLNGVGENQAEE